MILDRMSQLQLIIINKNQPNFRVFFTISGSLNAELLIFFMAAWMVIGNNNNIEREINFYFIIAPSNKYTQRHIY